MIFVNNDSPPRIFIIDNNIEDCSFMSHTLLRAGYKVDFTTDSQEGLASILKHPPNCLLINSVLSGTSGYAVCRHVRAFYANNIVPIIMLDAKNTSLDQNYSSRVGANYYLAKPCTPDALLQAVRNMLPAFSPITATAQASPLPPQSTVPKAVFPEDVSTLIPYRQNENEVMLKNNPFARASVIQDNQVRHLYAIIDGNRNIQELSAIAQLDLLSTLKLLKALWKSQHIAFFDAKRRPFLKTSLFDGMK